MREINDRKMAEERRAEINKHIDEYLKSGGKIELRGYLEKHDTKRASRKSDNSNSKLFEDGE
jgi:nucleoid DNA-binding protein